MFECLILCFKWNKITVNPSKSKYANKKHKTIKELALKYGCIYFTSQGRVLAWGGAGALYCIIYVII